MYGYDFDIIYRAGQWTVTVWGKREITPVKVKNVKVMDDTGFHYEESWVTHLRDYVGASKSRSSLNDALQDAYQTVKAKNL